MACGKVENSCGKTICEVYNEILDLIGDINIIPNDTNDDVNIGNKLKFLYEKISDQINKSDYEIVDSTSDMIVDGRLYILRPTKSLYGVFNGTVIALSSGTSSNVESDPIYQADKVNLQLKTDSRLNNISNDNNVVNSILNVDKGVNDLNTYVQNINELVAQRLADLQDSDSTLQDNIDNEATVRGAADTLQLNKINTNTSQINANANDIVTNKNNQTAINTQMTSEITTLDNKLTDFLNESIDDDSDLQNQINQNLDSINQLNVKVDTNKSVSDAEDAHLESRINTLEARSQLMTIVKNQGETNEQALARLITTPVTNQKVHVSDGNNHVSEWMWDGSKWVQTQANVTNSVDLSQYSTTTESDAKYATKTETATLLSKTEASTTYATQTSVASKVDKNIADSTYQTKASMSGYYTKTETDTKFIDNVELQDLFNSYFDWLGAKTFTVAGRLPDVTTQPTTGVAADVNKVVAYEGEDWFLFEINKAGTITYVWQPVAAANTYSAGDTFDRDSIVEFFTSPDGIHNLKVLSGAKDVQDYTFAEGVQRNLYIAPNAKGEITVGHYSITLLNSKLVEHGLKNIDQDTAIAGKQDTLTSTQLTNIAKINDINTKTTTHEDKLGKLGSLFDMTSNRGKLHLNGTDYYVKEDGTWINDRQETGKNTPNFMTWYVMEQVYAALETANKTPLGAINDLNSGKLNISATGITFDANGHVIENGTNTGKNYTEYIVGKSLAAVPPSLPTWTSTSISENNLITWDKQMSLQIGKSYTINVHHNNNDWFASSFKVTELNSITLENKIVNFKAGLQSDLVAHLNLSMATSSRLEISSIVTPYIGGQPLKVVVTQLD